MGARLIDNENWQSFASALEQDRRLPPGLLKAIASNETAGGSSKWINATSSAGAQGMFQFMPATAKQYNVNVADPADSTRGAADYLSDLHSKYGDPRLAAAAYNWGPANVDKAIAKARSTGVPVDAISLADSDLLPKETADYVRKLPAFYETSRKPFTAEVIDATRREVVALARRGLEDNAIVRKLARSPVGSMIADLKGSGVSDAEIVKQVGGDMLVGVKRVQGQGVGTNVAAGASDEASRVAMAGKQLGARLSGDDERLAQLQAEQREADASPERQALNDTFGGKIGSLLVKAAPYVAASALTGGGAVPLIAGQAVAGATDGALTPTTGDGQLAGNVVRNAALGGVTAGAGAVAGKGVHKMLGAALTSPAQAAERQAVIDAAKAQGLPVSASNVSPFWRGVRESMPENGNVRALQGKADDALASKVAEGLGETGYTGAIDTTLINKARDRIGAALNDATDIQVTLPQSLKADLGALLQREANPLTEGIAANATVNKAVANLVAAVDAGTPVTGRALQGLNSELKELTGSQVASAAEKRLAGQVSQEINDALYGAMTPEQQAAFKAANSQYRNLKAAEKMVLASNDTGVVSPRQVLQAVKTGRFKNAFLKDEAPFQELGTTASELYGPANGRGLGDVIGKALGSGDNVFGAASIVNPTAGLPAWAVKKLASRLLGKLATTENETIVRLLTGAGKGTKVDPAIAGYIAKALGGSVGATQG